MTCVLASSNNIHFSKKHATSSSWMAVTLTVIMLWASAALADVRVLALGDSNTWGSDGLGGRYANDIRWPRVLVSGLGDTVLIEEGRIGRRTELTSEVQLDNLIRPVDAALPEIVARHMPLDLVIVMLGTNDIQAAMNRNATSVSRSAFTLARILKAGGVSQVLVVTPPPLQNPQNGRLARLFGTSEQASNELRLAFARASRLTGIPHFDAGSVAQADGPDGVHMTAQAHQSLGIALAPVVTSLLDDLILFQSNGD